ncbi:MAG: DUF4340 domain-containing protein [Gemmatimonadetes bacterium]|nr:DUF4340 domain-containing protein [Gemmatimonadota bacterium]
MSSRQLKAIFGALVVLVLAYAAVQFLSGNGHRSGGNDIVAAVRDGISLVRILGPGAEDSVRLEEADGSWTVNGYPADSALVRQLSEGLDTAQIGRLVARSVTNHARLGVAEDSARRIKIGPAGDPYVEFLLGRGGPDGRYVRFPSSDEVFSLPAASMRLLAHSAEEWRNRIVAAVDTSLVSRIEVRRNDEPAPLELSRAIGDSAVSWSLGGGAVDSATVDALLGESANLTATGFPSDSVAFAVDFGSPVAVLEMFDSDELGAAPALSLLFLTAPDTRGFLVRRAADPLAYRISVVQARRLLPTRARLLPQATE